LSPAPPPPPLQGGPPPPLSRGRINKQRLYLVTPELGDPASFLPGLDAALAAADIAVVLLRLADADERTLVDRAKTVAAAVQRRDTALVLDGRADIVGRAGADGAHLIGIEAFSAALGTLKPDRIAGAGGLRSRHDAMLAGESGADYVMFGDPDHRGQRPPLDAAIERLQWWADLVEVPCIGYAASEDEVAALAQAGADFVALGDWLWTHPKGIAAAVAAAAGTLAAPVAKLPAS
jgi:thiamine-phosphate pyrophosphorylase